MINGDTKIFGSFSKKAGNTGTRIFNTCFRYYGLNAIYKSFSVANIDHAVSAARCLNFSGFAVSMPYKKLVLEYVDHITPEAQEIGSANTILNENGYLKAFNTDYYAAYKILQKKNRNKLIILGNGGYAAAVKYAANLLEVEYEIISRKNWNDIFDLKNELVYNCTPVEKINLHTTNDFVDCLTNTKTGKHLAFLQASKQFKIYTGLEFPLKIEQ